MSSKRAIRRNMCKGKRRFDSWDQAVKFNFNSKWITKDFGMRPYHCQFCNGYHIGHYKPI